MKPAVRAFLLAFGIPLGLLFLVWIGGILYWHVRVTLAIRAWERDPDRGSGKHPWEGLEEWSSILDDAGCRALPGLIRALDESGDVRLLNGVTGRLFHSVTQLQQ